MIEIPGIHLSLDEAREELKRRWNDKALKKAVEDELKENFLSYFKDKPRAMLGRCLPSPDNGFTFFFQRAKYINADPLAIEYLGDMFVSVNPEKKGLGRFRLYDDKGEKYQSDFVEFHKYEKRKINDVALKTGQPLADFHHSLLELSGYAVEVKDLTDWIQQLGSGKPCDFYYQYLLHFVAHGVIFENFEASDADEQGIKFLNLLMAKIISTIKNKFGLMPMAVRLYPDPDGQTAEEDFYWWCYPPHINEYLMQYAHDNNLPIKKLHF